MPNLVLFAFADLARAEQPHQKASGVLVAPSMEQNGLNGSAQLALEDRLTALLDSKLQHFAEQQFAEPTSFATLLSKYRAQDLHDGSFLQVPP